MNLYQAKTVVRTNIPLRMPMDFSDWYEADTVDQARELWTEDCHRYGLPMEQTTVEFIQVNPETLKPL